MKNMVKIGVLGAGRGKTMMNYCKCADNAELVAVCDSFEPLLNKVKSDLGDGVTYYTDFDEFLKHDMDAVVLANFANEHAPFAVKCLESGKNVISEVLPVSCLAEAVELIDAIEKSGLVYAYAENYCYMPAPKEMRRLYHEGKLGSFEYGEGEYMHNCEEGWYRYTQGNPGHWRNNMHANYYCTHSIGPLIHITGLRPVKVTGFELPYNARMARMGALAGHMGIQMITLENGAVIKTIQGVGPSKGSIWYSIYGSKGRLESAREDAESGGVDTLYINCNETEGGLDGKPVKTSPRDELSEKAESSGHGGSDYYTMYNFAEKLLGRPADVIDIYETLDMFLPGHFAYLSVLQGGIPLEIPDFRDKAVREKYRNDTASTFAAAGGRRMPSLSCGNPQVPREVYDSLKKKWEESL